MATLRSLIYLLYVAHAASAAASAQCHCAMQAGADCAGSDIKGAGVLSAATECCAECQKTDGCRAWTWHGPTGDTPHECFLKTDCANPTKNNKGGFAGVIFPPFPPYDPDPNCNHGERTRQLHLLWPAEPLFCCCCHILLLLLSLSLTFPLESTLASLLSLRLCPCCCTARYSLWCPP